MSSPQNSQGFYQTATIGLPSHDLSRFTTEFACHLNELHLDEQQRRKAAAQIATLQAQLADEPDPVIVNQAGRTLRNLTEGAIASLIATATQPHVWQWIQQIMVHFK